VIEVGYLKFWARGWFSYNMYPLVDGVFHPDSGRWLAYFVYGADGDGTIDDGTTTSFACKSG
jgi:hypothetical protein